MVRSVTIEAMILPTQSAGLAELNWKNRNLGTNNFGVLRLALAFQRARRSEKRDPEIPGAPSQRTPKALVTGQPRLPAGQHPQR